MALLHTPETPDLGAPCPDFRLLATDDKTYSLSDFSAGKALLVMFICNHCPYVIAVEDRIVALAHHFKNSSLAVVAISANDAARYPQDSLLKMKERAVEKNFPFPYLFDAEQTVAKSFGAVCTPDFFLYNQKRTLTYRGRLDDSWRDSKAVKSEDLKLAINATLTETELGQKIYPSMGCSIKWK
jgi:peroxiredoxin